MTIPKNKLTVILGNIGSGKSSLLYSILNEMKPSPESSICINGSIAFVPQKSWIMSGTLKENICFTLDEDMEKIEEVIKYASMEKDMELFTKGVDTIIGEKGVNLSGGQKARVSFARALYSDREIYLLDDLLSAVDVHVGNFLMKETLTKHLKGKTIIMATHSLKFAESADEIIIMKKGRIVKSGCRDEVLKSEEFDELKEEEKSEKK